MSDAITQQQISRVQWKQSAPALRVAANRRSSTRLLIAGGVWHGHIGMLHLKK